VKLIITALVCVSLAAPLALAQPPDDEAFVGPDDAALDNLLNPPGGKIAVVTDANLRPDGTRTDTDMSYETRVLGAFRTTQGSQGPLDGRWHVSGPDGAILYTLQLTDPGAGEPRIEGAWRNVKLSGLGASGFVETVRREGDDVVFAFREGPTEVPAEIRLRLEPNGVWTGLAVQGDLRQGVTANRGQGLETASMAVPEWRAPPPPPRAKAKAKSKSKSKAKSKNRRRR